MQSDPFEFFYLEKTFDEFHDTILSVDVTTIICQILSYEDKFLDAFLGEKFSLLDKSLHRH